MRQLPASLAILIIANLCTFTCFSQNTVITGSVKNASTGDDIPAASITVKGGIAGTFTDSKGEFRLTTTNNPPFTIVVTSVGYEPAEISISSAGETQAIQLNPTSTLGQEVVISATRTPSKILESPVTIERISAANIRNTASVSYYDMIGKLKGVDVVSSSLTFSTPSTRGFNGSGNLRVNQIVDGMDNQAPGLNFSLGSVIGLSELDVESVELLPGASSALYGPGGQNGAIVITSKDPFKYQGLSFQVKTGVMHIDKRERPVSPYYNWSLRWAEKIGDKFAFKIGGELIQAQDWLADDYRNYDRLGTTGAVVSGTRDTDPNYDGINVYGDETTADIKSNVLNPLAAAAPFYAPYVASLPNSIPVSRTGYTEKEFVNPNTVNAKFYAGLGYKLTPRLSLNAEGYLGSGNTVYTGSDRYSLLNLKMAQYKVELVHRKWFIRAYTTQENAGESFNATVTARLLNEAWKPSRGNTGWYAQYGIAFLNAKLDGQTDIDAHNTARAVADMGRPEPGTSQFRKLFDQVRSVPISQGGGLFVDKTDLYNAEVQYNFSEATSSFADILVGGNIKQYVLNSEGTLFADSTGPIKINEYGAYIQASKKILNDKVNLIASARYDKNENFDGKFTPRFSAVITVAEDNNIRLTYQTAYRFGSTQQQFINLRVGGGVALIGGNKSFEDYYEFKTNPIYTIDADLFAGNPQRVDFPKFKPETVNSFEAGYKGLLMAKKLLVDIYGYYGIYTNFITRFLVAQSVNNDISVFQDPSTVRVNLNNPAKATIYSIPTNVRSDVTTYGFGIGLTYQLPANFNIG
ncbi:TonB-dependent receptor [soil metagenome]